MTSVFNRYVSKSYPYRFAGTLLVRSMAGGGPSDPKVAEGWLKSKLDDPDEIIRQKVAETMLERNVDRDEATEIVASLKHLNGFRRDSHGLFIKGYQLKACIKEAACIAANAGKLPGAKWGTTNKGIKGWIPEHIFVAEENLYLGVTEPTGIAQRFVHTFRGSGIQYEEYVEEAKLDFTILTDYDFPAEQWAQIWLTAEQNGLGATRSQGYGVFEVVKWESITKKK